MTYEMCNQLTCWASLESTDIHLHWKFDKQAEVERLAYLTKHTFLSSKNTNMNCNKVC